MATPIATGDSHTTALLALANLEEQFAYLAQLLLAAQNTYNAANPNSPKNAITFVPNFSTSTLTIQSVLPLSSNAVTSFTSSSVAAVFS
jgi:hypothetical protein